MNINQNYNLKIRYDQFGNSVSDNFYDVSEEKLILEFEKNVGYKLTQEVYTDVDTVGGDGLIIFRK